MKIKLKSELLLNSLRRMSRVATDLHHNYRLVAKDIVEIYAQASSIYTKCVLTEVEVIEPGECLIPITALALIPNHRNITLTLDKENITVTYGKTSINIKLNYQEPDIIPIIEDKIVWSKRKHDRLLDISYAGSPDLNYTSCIWFMNGGAIASNGINTATYKSEEELNLGKIGLDISLTNRFSFEGEIFIQENKGSIWLGNDLGYSVMPGANFLMPDILGSLIGNKEQDLSAWFVVNMDEIKNDLGSITKLSESNDKYLCVLHAEGDNFNIIPQGNTVGNGNYNYTVLESMNKMLVAVNPKALVKTLNNCGKGIKTIGLCNVPGLTEVFTVIDDGITHYITPMRM